MGEKGLDSKIAGKIWSKITEEAVVACQDEDYGSERLKAEEIRLKKFKINYGLKDDHPLNHVKFFDKKRDPGSYKLDQRKLESMLPTQNQSWLVRCYLKPLDRGKEQ